MAASPRRRSVAVNVGGVKIGGDAPIVVQSMTNTDTVDVVSTVNQVMALAQAGSELVRLRRPCPRSPRLFISSEFAYR
jgi:(E)-4-hydroxy-3-methylbut-2-enyl-diphosphate synthase